MKALSAGTILGRKKALAGYTNRHHNSVCHSSDDYLIRHQNSETVCDQLRMKEPDAELIFLLVARPADRSTGARFAAEQSGARCSVAHFAAEQPASRCSAAHFAAEQPAVHCPLASR
jgi:hypothetical protein